MSSRLRKLTLLALVLLAAGALTACGESHTKVSTGTYAGESGANAPYLDVGSLKYEVQLSRELNPSSRSRTRPTCRVCRRPSGSSNRAGVVRGVLQVSTTAHRRCPRRATCRSPTRRAIATYRLSLGRTTPSPTTPAPCRPTAGCRGPTRSRRGRLRAGCVAAVQDPDRLARRPPAGRRGSSRRTTPLRRRPPSSTSSGRAPRRPQRVAFRPASSTSRATGAAVAPPAPSLTSSTPTTMRGESAGAKDANHASVLLASLAVP